MQTIRRGALLGLAACAMLLMGAAKGIGRSAPAAGGYDALVGERGAISSSRQVWRGGGCLRGPALKVVLARPASHHPAPTWRLTSMALRRP